MRVYQAANSKWKFSGIVKWNGGLTTEVRRSLIRWHVDQIYAVNDKVQENDFIPNIYCSFFSYQSSRKQPKSSTCMLRQLRIHLHKSHMKNKVSLPCQQSSQLMSHFRTHHHQMCSQIDLQQGVHHFQQAWDKFQDVVERSDILQRDLIFKEEGNVRSKCLVTVT